MKTLLLFLFCIILITGCTKIQEEKLISYNSESTTGVLKLNIIIILEDDIGYEIPTYTGGQSYNTPVMNSLAQSGMQFAHCYASAMCSPSRVMLLTGKYGFRNYKDWSILDTSQRTIANMLHNAGYATCVSGKWQLDGGNASIHKFGFDKYSIFDPFNELPRSNDSIENKYRYKNPTIYQANTYLPDSLTNGKYSDDMFTNYACNFIDTNKAKPFFLYFSFSECHEPFMPPPNNPDYVWWDPLNDKGTKTYFPFMVSYMDSKINRIINKVSALGLQNKTVIFILSDNGTPTAISSVYNGRKITGSKKETTEFGVHVPLIVWGAGVLPNSINRNIVDFTDFLPTIANLTNVSSLKYQSDGQSFSAQLADPGLAGRTWSYCYFQPFKNTPSQRRIYVQDTTYKLYDNTNNNNFYNTQKDSSELFPIPDDQLTPNELIVKQNFQSVLAGMHN
jgi:arylsulfatase A